MNESSKEKKIETFKPCPSIIHAAEQTQIIARGSIVSCCVSAIPWLGYRPEPSKFGWAHREPSLLLLHYFIAGLRIEFGERVISSNKVVDGVVIMSQAIFENFNKEWDCRPRR